MKIVFLTNTGFSHVQGSKIFIRELLKKHEVHVFVSERFDLKIERCDNLSVYKYSLILDKKSSDLIREYPEYNGGIGKLTNIKSLDDMLLEMKTMLVYMLRASANYHSFLIETVREINPDLIIRDSCAIFGRSIGDELKIPVMGFTTCPMVRVDEIESSKREFLGLLNNFNFDPYSDDQIDNFYNEVTKQFKYICNEFKMRDLPINFLVNPDEIFNFSYGLPFKQNHNNNYAYFNPLERFDGFIKDIKFNRNERDLIYVSSGSQLTFPVNIYNSIISFFANLDLRLIISFRFKNKGFINLRKLPKNVIIEEYIEQEKVLSLSQVFITHGGYNSIIESISKKVPMIVFPISNDQFINADFVQKNGIGLSIPWRDVDSKSDIMKIYSRLQEKTDEEYNDNFDNLHERFQELFSLSELNVLINNILSI